MDEDDLRAVRPRYDEEDEYFKPGDIVYQDKRTGAPIGIYVGKGEIQVNTDPGKSVVTKFYDQRSINAQIVEIVQLMTKTLVESLEMDKVEAARKLRWATYVVENDHT